MRGESRTYRHLETSVTDEQVPKCRSVLLQGRAYEEAKNVFLFPDGSGSASSYARIGKIDSSSVTLIGLNCPYVLNPTEMSCSLDQLIASYLAEIRRRQPTGPYRLGGWSVGGILAFHAAHVLIQEEEDVESLLLIDAPPPTTGLDKLPQHFLDHCSKHGLWGKENMSADGPPSRTAQHFEAMMDLLTDYKAEPLPQGVIPHVYILWATETAFDGVKFPKMDPHKDDVEHMTFLTEEREDFTPGRWQELFHDEECKVMSAKGVDHFNMMRDASNPVAKFVDWSISHEA